jgi:hypothetical protein
VIPVANVILSVRAVACVCVWVSVSLRLFLFVSLSLYLDGYGGVGLP